MDEPLSCRPLTTKVDRDICDVYQNDGTCSIQIWSDVYGRHNNESFAESLNFWILGDATITTVAMTKESDAPTTVNEVVVEQGYVETNKKLNWRMQVVVGM